MSVSWIAVNGFYMVAGALIIGGIAWMAWASSKLKSPLRDNLDCLSLKPETTRRHNIVSVRW